MTYQPLTNPERITQNRVVKLFREQLGYSYLGNLDSLVHKFVKRDVDDFDAFIEQLQSQPSHAAGELFIFVDECHRTQSGKLHKTMKALLPGALFIGFIVDYKDLFKKLVNEKGTGAIQVYTEALDYGQFEAKDCDILMQDRLSKGREWLDNALEALELLCEKVEPPKGDLQHIHYFCGNTEIPEDLKAHEVQRTALYKASAKLLRAFATIGDDMDAAGYSADAIEHIRNRVDHFLKLRDVIKNASNEKIDLKAYEADMRHLIDRYIQAEESVVISSFADMPILQVIVKSGIAVAIGAMPEGIRSNQEAVAETIENNLRNHIIKNHLLDPAYFENQLIWAETEK